MSIGLILFTLADSTVQPEFNRTGKLGHANIVMQCCLFKIKFKVATVAKL